MSTEQFNAAKALSPRRKTTQANSIEQLAEEQLGHFGIKADTAYGQTLKQTAISIYNAQSDVSRLWQITNETIEGLDKSDRIAYFNAKKFLSFQIAKVLDTLQNPFRKSYQALNYTEETQITKGPYSLFDNVTALFSATPVIVRTATYYYACTEWVDDAFHGKEPTHQIYSRLLNPTSISLANAIVDLECGKYAADYLAWNFNSGMAACDALLSNVCSRDDILIVSRNIYGGVYQLLNDYFARADKFNVKLEWFDGYSADELAPVIKDVKARNADRIANGAKVHFYMESPCNPHGYMLDVPAISKLCHQEDMVVMLDSTLATPFLNKPFMREDKAERPDYIVHSYTKDISGNGAATAGVVIGETYRMFMAKGDTVNGFPWNKTMFWDVYYIKGAFLDADKAWEVLAGMRTMEMRLIKKAINTTVFARFLSSNAEVNVNCNALPTNSNAGMREKLLSHGMPCSLFTIDMERAGFSRAAFTRFFDALEPALSQQVSIGQPNTMVLCPALTSHSELSETALKQARIYPTTIRIAMGDENPKELCAHIVNAARMTLDKEKPGFSAKFMKAEALDKMVREVYMEMHSRVIDASANTKTYLD